MLQNQIVLWLSLMSMALSIVEEHQYCSIRYRRLCQGKGRHVACQFPDPGPGASCRKYMAIKFSSELKHFVSNFLNRRRQRIAAGNERVRGGVQLPKPQAMMLVEWDRELASLAQRLADQCHFVHDDCRATVRYPYAGQTVGEVRWRRTSESDELTAQRAIRRVLDAWWGERRRVQPKQLIAPFRLNSRGTVWGHFSQLAVWNLQAVGCGAVRHGAFHSRLLLVCDFSHTNMLGQRTLVPGPQAPCPIHTARKSRSAYPLLCAPVRYHITNDDDDDLDAEHEYEDDDVEDMGSDEEDKVEVGSVPSSVWSKNVEKPVRGYVNDQVDQGESTEKKILVMNTERAISLSSNSEKYQFIAEDDVQKEWQTRRTYFGRWRQDREKVQDAVPVSVDTQDELSSAYKPTFDNPPLRKEAAREHVEPRQRWKQTRHRPQRPGANALLTNASTVKQPKKSIVASLILDKDDTAQLFQDTGFSVDPNKLSTSSL